MFDAAQQYETHVVDVEDLEDSPDFEFNVQALVAGAWHRTISGPHVIDETACSHPFTVRHRPVMRREVLSERAVFDTPAAPLCSDCFTPHEILRARERDAAEVERERQQTEADKQRWDGFFVTLHTKRPPTQGDR